MLTIIDAVKTNKRIKRKIHSDYLENWVMGLTKVDILSNDWEFEGQNWIEMTEYNLPYKIDNMGNVYSYRLKKLFTPKITNHGYYEITLRDKNNKSKSYLVHLLVAKYHLNHIPIKGGLVVNHIDGNKLNNNVDNFEIVTRSRNSKHAYELGLNPGKPGEKSGMSKLKNEDVLKIRELAKLGQLSHKEIGKLFGISQSAISLIVSRKTWKHI